jgi:2-keto-4-pentenoate hydratase/2-oxohepta-3-ene-1,7-dioic acid hydratase in catechol pathway
MVGANDDVALPYDSAQSDWEIELAAVIGRPGRRLSRESALDVVAGYTICNDLTSRDALNRPDAGPLGIDWLAGKNSPTFLPMGPFLVPARFVDDPMSLQLRLAVNGEVMQDDSTAGNGASYGIFLKPGDVMDATIEGLGTQRNTCVAETPPDGAPATGEMAATREGKGGDE